MSDAEEVDTARWAVGDLLGVITMFERMLLAMETRLTTKMDDNARDVAERWRRHDEDRAEAFRRQNDRFEKLESILETHLDKERDEDLVRDARVKPITTTAGWLWAHWRDLVLLAIGLVALVNALRINLGI